MALFFLSTKYPMVHPDNFVVSCSCDRHVRLREAVAPYLLSGGGKEMSYYVFPSFDFCEFLKEVMNVLMNIKIFLLARCQWIEWRHGDQRHPPLYMNVSHHNIPQNIDFSKLAPYDSNLVHLLVRRYHPYMARPRFLRHAYVLSHQS